MSQPRTPPNAPTMRRAELIAWVKEVLLAGGTIAPLQISYRGLRAADPISRIRRGDLIPIACVKTAPPPVTVTGKDGKPRLKRQRPKTDHYKITAPELHRYYHDRDGQITDMVEQHRNRCRYNLATRAIKEMCAEGLLSDIPKTFLTWAALTVPPAGAGTSAPLLLSDTHEQDA